MKRMLMVGLVAGIALAALAETSEARLFRRARSRSNSCSTCNTCNTGMQGQPYQANYGSDAMANPSLDQSQLNSPPPVPGDSSINGQGNIQANPNQPSAGVQGQATTPRGRKLKGSAQAQPQK